MEEMINIHFRDKNCWNDFGSTYMRGDAYSNEHLIDCFFIHNALLERKKMDDILSLIKQLNGFFAIIHQEDKKLVVAVDRIRSIPIFYSLNSNRIYISDDPHWIKKQINYEDIDELSATEFLLTAYVTGNDTLYPSIKQLQAGEALVLELTSEGFHASTIRYYEYIHENYYHCSQEELLARLDSTLVSVFNRLVQWANGRTIVVPLSGGYDSRLIVLMLKRLGYENVIAFSYGHVGNEESEMSKRVAQCLGVQWEFVPYNNELWYRWYNSEDWKKYSHMACGLCSVPHLQDWPAVWELKKQGLIPEDSVFVPGHTGDFISGGHIPTGFIYKHLILKEDLIDSIYNKHYTLWDWSQEKKQLEPKFEDKIEIIIGNKSTYGKETAASLYERWEWQERQAKFIVNSVRVYEFWGYHWWLPFWDNEFMDFWSRVPLTERINEYLYKTYVDKFFQDITDDCLNIEDKGICFRNSAMKIARIILLKSRLYSFAKKPYGYIYFNLKCLKEYEKNPLAFYGIVPKKKFKAYFTGKENINSFLAMDIIENIAPNPKSKDTLFGFINK